MLNLKKVIALVCVFALALTTVAFGATYSDVTEDSAYYEAVETLNKLEIVTGYEDGTFKPEDGVTRAEMAALIARIQGYGETAKGAANTAFTDVPASHWASGYIANAAGMGIINGYGDGNFGPEDPVLYEQAVKMVMATLGYTPFAEKNGGYPTGYLAAAQRYDVSLAVANAAVGQKANRGTVAQLLENALDTPLMVQSKWNTNGEVEYVIADGKDNRDYKTLMSENLGYVKIRGVVEAADCIDLESEGEITINPNTGKDKGPSIWIDVQDAYKTNNTDFYDNTGALKSSADRSYYTGSMDIDEAEYLGRSVIGYAKKDAMDDYQLVSIAVDTSRDDTLVINLDSYAGIDSACKISYVRDGANDTTEVNVDTDASVIYNNVCVSDGATTGVKTAFDAVIPSTPCLYGGTITLIDNDEYNGYDVAIIEAAATAVVKKVTEDMVAFKTGTTLSNGNVMAGIELGREDKIVEIYKDGELIDAAELNEWDVLSVIANKDNSTIIVAEVVTNQVVGTVTSSKTSKTSATKAYKIDGAWYDVATSHYKAGVNDLEIGVGGTFYIDKYGKIAAFDEDSALAGGAAANYGYVAAVEGKKYDFQVGGLGYDVRIQMITADGVELLTLKKNAKINVAVDAVDNATGAATPDGNNDTWTIDSSTWAAADVVIDITAKEGTVTGTQDTAIEDLVAALNGMVVKYVKNSAGQISEITVADHDTDKFKKITYTDNASAEFDADNSRFTSGGGYVDSDAIVFIIGGFTGGAGYTSVTDSKVGTLADLDDENTYTLAARYADAKADDCNIIVIDADTVATSATSGLAVITEVGESTNDDSEPIYILSYYVDGELNEGVSSIARTDLGVALTAGDVVKVKVGSDGLISDIKMVFDFGTDVRTAYNNGAALSIATNANDTTTKEIFAGGTVLDYKDSSTLATIATDYLAYSGNSGSAGTNSATEYKLSQAENVYVIDGTGLNMTVKVGSDANFRVFEKLYDGTANVKVYLDDVVVPGNTGATDLDTDGDGTADAQSLTTVAAAQAYADHVYVRAYEGKVKDVIIVKTDADLRIK